mmetsp:Transcript_36754/g.82802  ORF Transcript_36754/g.82802 Transcript_36754/m.82802 type:complete len:226 (-) Transcript_36754:298-975(-)
MVHHRLATHQQDRPSALAQHVLHLRQIAQRRADDPPWLREREHKVVDAMEEVVQVPRDESSDQPGRDALALRNAVHIVLQNCFHWVYDVNRELDENRAGHSLQAHFERSLQLLHHRSHRLRRRRVLHKRLEQFDLIDVLQRALAPQQGSRCPCYQHHSALRHLGILQGRDGVGDSRPCSHHRNARNSAHSPVSVSSEDAVDFMADVNYLHASLLCCDVHGGHVSS